MRRLLLPAAVAVAALAGASPALASQPPPPAVVQPPPVVPPPDAAQPPEPAPAPPAPAPPVAPRTPAPPQARGAFAWARPAATRLVTQGAWPELAGADLGRTATRADLDRAIGILSGAPQQSGTPSAPATAYATHLQFVRALGLEPELQGLSALSVDGGQTIRLPRNFASEVLARELGLVHNYPASQDRLERARIEPLRLGDIVGMLDRARALTPWQLQRMARYRDVRLPAMSPARLAVVQAALWQVGQPYVWGGDWPGTLSPWGRQAHGGFDCSGLVWWAFKGSAGPRQMELGRGLGGRTADAMAWERPAERVAIATLASGDLIFFGPGGPKSRRGSISHTGIALGNGWMVHSSGSRGGVSVSFLADYWPSAMAFGRHVAQLGP